MHQVHESIAGLIIDIQTLLPHPDNPREHDEDVIRESLILNGQYGPIVVQASTRYILAGNGTYAAAMSLGWTHIAAVVLDVDNVEAQKILLADNRINATGDNDPEALLALLRTLDGDFTGSGYTPADLNELIATIDSTPIVDDAYQPGDFEPTNPSLTLRSVTLTYPAQVFEDLVGGLMELRESETETFTAVVQRLAADRLASA